MLDGGFGGGLPFDPAILPTGAARRSGRVVCCPKCRSVDVSRRDNGAGGGRVRWSCGECDHAWKEASGLAVVRAYLVVPP
jgi:ribosomal protein L37AE/L43A